MAEKADSGYDPTADLGGIEMPHCNEAPDLMPASALSCLVWQDWGSID